jgi:hypothetical protein
MTAPVVIVATGESESTPMSPTATETPETVAALVEVAAAAGAAVERSETAEATAQSTESSLSGLQSMLLSQESRLAAMESRQMAMEAAMVEEPPVEDVGAVEEIPVASTASSAPPEKKRGALMHFFLGKQRGGSPDE